LAEHKLGLKLEQDLVRLEKAHVGVLFERLLELRVAVRLV